MINGRHASWADIRRAAPEAEADEATARDDFQKLTARVFSTADGENWLHQMYRQKFLASTDPDMPESRLRHLEGQRQLLRDILRDVTEGLARMKGRGAP